MGELDRNSRIVAECEIQMNERSFIYAVGFFTEQKTTKSVGTNINDWIRR